MPSQPSIQYVSHHNIDKAAWNNCIDQSANGLLYGKTIFLDSICPNWDGLVMNDYVAVMPLPWRSKLGIKYLYQPWGLAQGGIFSLQPLTPVIENAFLDEIFRHFRYGTVELNETSKLENFPSMKIVKRCNYVLDLNMPYEKLFNRYDADGKKNLRRAARFDQQFRREAPMSTVIALYRQQYGEKNSNAGQLEYERFEWLAEKLSQEDSGFCCGVQHAETGEWLAAAFFGKYRHRLYYLLGAPSALGRNCKSTYFLIDSVIRQYAGQPYLLDFEGSDIPSVAAFYQKFGPENRPYPSLHFNHLPAPVRWLKK